RTYSMATFQRQCPSDERALADDTLRLDTFDRFDFFRRLDRALLLLQRPHPGVGAAPRQQLAVRAALDDPAALEHQDLVRGHDSGQAVRDDERRVIGGDLLELGL